MVLITWTAYSPLQWDREVLEYDNYDRATYSIGICYSEKSTPFVWSLVLINGVAVILALYQAYRARKITTEFSESRHIAMAMIMIGQSLFIGIPIFVIVNGQPTPEFFVLSAIVFIIVVSMLSLIFLPKILIMRRGDEGLPSNYNPRGSTWMRSSKSDLMRSTRQLQSFRNPSAMNLGANAASSSRDLLKSGSSPVPPPDRTGTKAVTFSNEPSTKVSMEEQLASYAGNSDSLPMVDDESEIEVDADSITCTKSEKEIECEQHRVD